MKIHNGNNRLGRRLRPWDVPAAPERGCGATSASDTTAFSPGSSWIASRTWSPAGGPRLSAVGPRPSAVGWQKACLEALPDMLW